jgi:ABC-type glycerol-3-phosphate transport system substrate-binding protein
MRKNHLVLLSVAALASIGALTGCQNSNNSKSADEIWICAYDGGYGSQWLADVTAAFTAKTGIKVHYDVDTSILDRIESALKSGGDYDIYMSHGINWQSYAANGWLADLDDLYTTTVDGFDGTFADRLANGAANLSKITGNDSKEHYYKVCYTQGAGGFVYNVDMFKNNNWTVPTTYDDLTALCKKIVDAKISDGDRGTITPIAWSGKDRQYYWDYPVFEWWYQLAGKDKVDTVTKYMGPTGKYADGYEMYNPDTYYKEFMQAYQMWYDLIATNSANSMASSYSASLSTAQANFVNQKSAMIPYAQWAKFELSSIAEGGKLPFNVAMMKTPKATATAADCNYMVGFGDSMIIPANSSQIANAKKFLNYMATQDACKTFVKDSNGAFLAFDYSKVDLSDIESTDTFVKSVHEKLSTTDFSLSSTNPITYRTVNCVMPWALNKYYYQQACQEPDKNTAALVGAAVYQTAKSNWPTWLRNASLTD